MMKLLDQTVSGEGQQVQCDSIYECLRTERRFRAYVVIDSVPRQSRAVMEMWTKDGWKNAAMMTHNQIALLGVNYSCGYRKDGPITRDFDSINARLLELTELATGSDK